MQAAGHKADESCDRELKQRAELGDYLGLSVYCNQHHSNKTYIDFSLDSFFMKKILIVSKTSYTSSPNIMHDLSTVTECISCQYLLIMTGNIELDCV